MAAGRTFDGGCAGIAGASDASRVDQWGGLHLAHINRSENGDQKSFGSAFWHNLARATWFVKHAGTSPDGAQMTVGLFNRKANLVRLYPAVGFQFAFTDDRTRVSRVNLAKVEDLAGQLRCGSASRISRGRALRSRLRN